MSVQRHYVLEVDERSDVLLRVLSTCQTRRCPVVAVDYRRGDRHRSTQLLLTVAGGPARGDLATRLGRLVDVRRVEERPVGAST